LHIRHRLSPDVEVVILYEACFDALPKFMFAPGEGLAGKQTPGTTAAHMTPDESRIACFQFGCCLVRLAAPGAAAAVCSTCCSTRGSAAPTCRRTSLRTRRRGRSSTRDGALE